MGIRKLLKSKKFSLEGRPLYYPAKCDFCKNETPYCKKIILSKGVHACVR